MDSQPHVPDSGRQHADGVDPPPHHPDRRSARRRGLRDPGDAGTIGRWLGSPDGRRPVRDAIRPARPQGRGHRQHHDLGPGQVVLDRGPVHGQHLRAAAVDQPARRGRDVHAGPRDLVGAVGRRPDLDVQAARRRHLPRRHADGCDRRGPFDRGGQGAWRGQLHLGAARHDHRDRPADGHDDPQVRGTDGPRRLVAVRRVDRQPEGARRRRSRRDLLRIGRRRRHRAVHDRVLQA